MERGCGTLKILSPEFKNDEYIPREFTCEGENINPELQIKGIPEDTKSLVIIMDDPDSVSKDFVHWLVYDLPVVEKIEQRNQLGINGTNSTGKLGYTGPCPGKGRTHHYHFKVYALDVELGAEKDMDKQLLLKAMEGHILDGSELIGLYKR